jgi:hypothetical protein
MARGLSPDLREFLYRHFESAVNVEALLAIYRSGEGWEPGRLATELDVDEDAAMDLLVRLHWQGFLGHEQANGAYRFAPRDEALARGVTEMARVPLSRLIAEIDAYAAPRSFADAFRIGRGKPDGGKHG